MPFKAPLSTVGAPAAGVRRGIEGDLNQAVIVEEAFDATAILLNCRAGNRAQPPEAVVGLLSEVCAFEEGRNVEAVEPNVVRDLVRGRFVPPELESSRWEAGDAG